MKLTPLDIRKQEFKRTLRGFDVEEVQSFLQMVSSQWDEMQADQRRMEQRANELENKLQHYVKIEEALQEALRTARESSKQAAEMAKQQAEGVLRDAERQAVEVLHAAERDRKALRREADDVRTKRNEIVARLRSFLQSEIELLTHYEAEHPLETDVPASTSRGTSGRKAEAGPVPRREDTWKEPSAPPVPEEERDFLYYGDAKEEEPDAAPSPRPLTASEETQAGNFQPAVPSVQPVDRTEVEARPASDEEPASREEPRTAGWKVTPVISAPTSSEAPTEEAEADEGAEEPQKDEESNEESFNIAASTDEIERIRRILKDLE